MYSIKNITYNTKALDKKFKEYDPYVCIPMTKDKKPIISWKGLSETPKSSFKSDHNIAILTGKINQITVIDIDNLKTDSAEKDGMKLYQELLDKYNKGEELDIPMCVTQSKGLHLYFKYDPEIMTTTKVNGYSIDIRNDGGLIVAPPSIGNKGPYVWKKSLHETELSEIPGWFKDFILSEKSNIKTIKSKKIKEKIKGNAVEDEPGKDISYTYIYDQNHILELLNALPKKYRDNYSDWITISTCLKSENLKDIWDQWSRDGFGYDMDNNNKIWDRLEIDLDICYLSVIANKEGIMSNIKKTIKPNFLTIKPDCQINDKYVNMKHLNDMNTQIIKSNCGTGKTTLITSYINKLLKTNNKLKVLSISVRISLAYQQVKTFEDNKIIMAMYKDLTADNINKQDKLIIQIDSICKLDINVWKESIIYLDEIYSILGYILSSDTLKGKRHIIFTTLCKLLKQASYILCTDADVNDMVIKFFDLLEIKYHFIENTYKTIKETKAYEYLCKNVLIKDMEQTLLDNKKIICCFDSKKEMEVIVQRLKGFCENNKLDKQLKNFLVYSSEEGDEKDFLNINDKWKSKNIFYTPKITIGVSFDNKISRKVYLIAQTNSINSFGFVQQISRCRNISELHYYIADKYVPIKYESVDSTRQYFAELLDNFESQYNQSLEVDPDTYNLWIPDSVKIRNLYENHCIGTNYQTCKRYFNNDIFIDLFFMQEYHDNIIRSAPREQFRWMIESYGYNIEYMNQIIDIDDIEITESNRVLYNPYNSLTDSEKVVYENAKKYAKFLNIDFNSKVAKKKCEKILLSDKLFIQHFTYQMLIGETPSRQQMKKEYGIIVAGNLYQKVELIKQLEVVLDIKSFDIDTKIDIKRFGEEVDVDNDLKNNINKSFRFIKNIEDENLESFRFWYYRLIQMYKHIFGEDIFDRVERRLNYEHYYSYSINHDIYNQLKLQL
jgi:hypothetical protein